MSTRPVVFNLINCIIGVSVLAMPFCFQECGIILCAMAIISSSWLTKKSCELLLKSGHVSRRRTYESLALATYGGAGKLVVETSIIGLLMGTLIAMNVIIGDILPSIFFNFSGVQVSWLVRAVLMTILAFGVGLPLSLMRNLHSLASFSLLSLIFYMTFVAQIFWSALPEIIQWAWVTDVNYWRPENLLHSLPIFALAFACQTQLFALYETLPEPSVKKMEGVVNTGLNVVAAVYFLVGLFGYICFYSVGVSGDMLNNYSNSFGSLCVKLGFVMSVIVSFPLMVYPLRTSLHSLIFQQSNSSENLPGGSGFIPQDRFTYLTVGIISVTLLLGILFPQIEFVLALTGATMGTMIAFIFPSNIYLHVVSEQTQHSRLTAKLVLVLGLVCFVTGTYTVLMAENRAENGSNQVNIHPPGIDPIQPVAGQGAIIQKPLFIPDAARQDNQTNLLAKDAKAVDIDVAKIGLEGGHALKREDKVGNENLKAGEAKPMDVKIINDAANEGLNLKADDPVKPVEGEAKRQEPPVPHAPADKHEGDAPDELQQDKEHSKDKRQLMSNREEDQSPDDKEITSLKDSRGGIAARNVVADEFKVSNQEIDEEVKKLEQPDKVHDGEDDSVKEGGQKEAVHMESYLQKEKNSRDKSVVKRDGEHSQPSTKKDSMDLSDDKERISREEFSAQRTFDNKTSSQNKELNAAENKELADSLHHPEVQRSLHNSENTTSVRENHHNSEQGVKIRDLKSKGKPMNVKHFPVSSNSWRAFLSKKHSKKLTRSKVQAKAR